MLVQQSVGFMFCKPAVLSTRSVVRACMALLLDDLGDGHFTEPFWGVLPPDSTCGACCWQRGAKLCQRSHGDSRRRHVVDGPWLPRVRPACRAWPGQAPHCCSRAAVVLHQPVKLTLLGHCAQHKAWPQASLPFFSSVSLLLLLCSNSNATHGLRPSKSTLT